MSGVCFVVIFGDEVTYTKKADGAGRCRLLRGNWRGLRVSPSRASRALDPEEILRRIQ
jgi:hypothetical protein